MTFLSKQGPKCPVCNRVVVEVVPMQDSGKGEKVCVKCKRAIKAGEPITWKFKRVDTDGIKELLHGDKNVEAGQEV